MVQFAWERAESIAARARFRARSPRPPLRFRSQRAALRRSSRFQHMAKKPGLVMPRRFNYEGAGLTSWCVRRGSVDEVATPDSLRQYERFRLCARCTLFPFLVVWDDPRSQQLRGLNRRQARRSKVRTARAAGYKASTSTCQLRLGDSESRAHAAVPAFTTDVTSIRSRTRGNIGPTGPRRQRSASCAGMLDPQATMLVRRRKSGGRRLNDRTGMNLGSAGSHGKAEVLRARGSQWTNGRIRAEPVET